MNAIDEFRPEPCAAAMARSCRWKSGSGNG